MDRQIVGQRARERDTYIYLEREREREREKGKVGEELKGREREVNDKKKIGKHVLEVMYRIIQ